MLSYSSCCRVILSAKSSQVPGIPYPLVPVLHFIPPFLFLILSPLLFAVLGIVQGLAGATTEAKDAPGPWCAGSFRWEFWNRMHLSCHKELSFIPTTQLMQQFLSGKGSIAILFSEYGFQNNPMFLSWPDPSVFAECFLCSKTVICTFLGLGLEQTLWEMKEHQQNNILAATYRKQDETNNESGSTETENNSGLRTETFRTLAISEANLDKILRNKWLARD